jgi:hypothetical protein
VDDSVIPEAQIDSRILADLPAAAQSLYPATVPFHGAINGMMRVEEDLRRCDLVETGIFLFIPELQARFRLDWRLSVEMSTPNDLA